VRILSRYFVLGYLTYYAAILTVGFLVIALVEMMVNFEHVIDFGEGLAGVLSYLFLRVPSYYLQFLLPVGSFGGAFLCFGLPARAREILAIKTSGIAPARVAAPVLATACLCSLVALVVNDTVVLGATRRIEGSADGGELFQSRGAFWYQRGNTLFNVQAADRDSRTLQGVAIYERDSKGHLLRSVHADVAHIEADHRWRLQNARFREFVKSDPESAPHTKTREVAWFEIGSGGELALLGADPRELPLPRLRAYIRALDGEGRDTRRYRALWHARLADPFSVLLFAVIGAPLGFSVERARSLTAAAIEGIAVLAGYYALQTSASVVGAGGFSAAVLAPWFVLAGFAAYGVWSFSRTPS
jgi:LPS export ABC transporter permease LptG